MGKREREGLSERRNSSTSDTHTHTHTHIVIEKSTYRSSHWLQKSVRGLSYMCLVYNLFHNIGSIQKMYTGLLQE